MNGKPMRPPKFYERILEKEHPEMYNYIKLNRKLERGDETIHDTLYRLEARCELKNYRVNKSQRSYEHGK